MTTFCGEYSWRMCKANDFQLVKLHGEFLGKYFDPGHLLSRNNALAYACIGHVERKPLHRWLFPWKLFIEIHWVVFTYRRAVSNYAYWWPVLEFLERKLTEYCQRSWETMILQLRRMQDTHSSTYSTIPSLTLTLSLSINISAVSPGLPFE